MSITRTELEYLIEIAPEEFEEQKREEESLDAIMTEKSANLTIVVSENGRRSYRFSTPRLEGYMLGRDP